MSTFQSQDLIATLALVVTLAGRFMLLLVNSSNQLTLVRPYLNPQRTAIVPTPVLTIMYLFFVYLTLLCPLQQECACALLTLRKSEDNIVR